MHGDVILEDESNDSVNVHAQSGTVDMHVQPFICILKACNFLEMHGNKLEPYAYDFLLWVWKDYHGLGPIMRIRSSESCMNERDFRM